MSVEKLWSSYSPLADSTTFVGDQSHIFYDSDTGDLRLSDGATPGGKPLTLNEIRFDTSHITDPSAPTGTLCWNTPDDTLNLVHSNGVIQQIGQEMYGYVKNASGSTISNGEVVRFAGAETNGSSRLLVAPFRANGEFPTLYGFGIATEDIVNGAEGRVTVWGKVRKTDTSSFSIGDILYVDPVTAGRLTNVKPTAPDNVIPIAVVLLADAEIGEIFVRPSYEQQKGYGAFTSTQTQSLTAANTASDVIFDNIATNQRIDIDPDDPTRIVFRESGFYNMIIDLQLKSTNASAKDVYVWHARNGVDVPSTSRISTFTGNDEYKNFTIAYNISAEANTYVQFRWASTNDAIDLVAEPASSFAPASPSVQLDITQTAL